MQLLESQQVCTRSMLSFAWWPIVQHAAVLLHASSVCCVHGRDCPPTPCCKGSLIAAGKSETVSYCLGAGRTLSLMNTGPCCGGSRTCWTTRRCRCRSRCRTCTGPSRPVPPVTTRCVLRACASGVSDPTVTSGVLHAACTYTAPSVQLRLLALMHQELASVLSA